MCAPLHSIHTLLSSPQQSILDIITGLPTGCSQVSQHALRDRLLALTQPLAWHIPQDLSRVFNPQTSSRSVSAQPNNMDSLGPLVESFTSPALLPIPIFAALCLAYAALAPFFSTERKRAYILSVLSSAVMSAISLPYVCLYLRYGLHEAYERAQTGWLDSLGKFAVTYFGTYLVGEWKPYCSRSPLTTAQRISPSVT